MMKTKLNEFQADWAAMPQLEKEQLTKLKNKTILVSGHSLARCLCYALLYQNDARKLNIKVIFAAQSKEEAGALYPDIILRDDFDFVDYQSLFEIKKADYVIHTGYCCESDDSFSAAFAREIASAQAVAACVRRTKARLILLSDSRVYGVAKAHRIYAENEYAGIDNTAFETFDNQLLRAVEALMNCEQKAHGFEMTTLRTGIILGACTGINTFLDDTLRAVAQGKETTLFSSDHKYSFVYITDVFRAIVYSITTLETNQIYNIAGINSTLSTASVAAILHDIYGTDAQITLTDNEEKGFCPVSTGKSETYGFTAAINIETALELCVMSFMTDKSGLSLPNTHDGRLDAIQKIQLAYLLEVDRICRKHDIKYFLGGGTLLGAIRHKGFIPWDDDSDIMMLREDYEKFCQIAVSELPANMSFQSNKTDRNCFYEFAKLRIDDTAFATVFAKEHKSMHNGIAFDIFCHDKTANSRFGQKLHMAMTIFTRALVFNKWNHRKTENDSRMQTAFTNFCVRLFPLRFSCRLMNHTISFFKRKKNAKYLYDGMGRNVYNGVFPIELLDEVIYVDFEGYPLPVPKRYDEYLKFLYGDYMELAPLSTRLGCHEILLCDIGKYDILN